MIESAVSSSGAPRKIAGMKSTKVCVIAIDVMRIISAMGERNERINAEEEIKMRAIRLVWIPGMSPVIVPAKIPRSKAIRSCNITI